MGIIHVNFREPRSRTTIVRVRPLGFVLATLTTSLVCASIYPVVMTIMSAFETYLNALQLK